MAVSASKVTVGNTATQLLSVTEHAVDVYLNASADIKIGPDNTVTWASSFTVTSASGEHGPYRLQRGDELWGITFSGTSDVRVLTAEA